jgi:hypothetical protein
MRGTIILPGNVFHVPDALTVIVYLLMPVGRGTGNAAFRCASGQHLPGFGEAIPRSLSVTVSGGSRTPRSAVSEVDQALLYHLG